MVVWLKKVNEKKFCLPNLPIYVETLVETNNFFGLINAVYFSCDLNGRSLQHDMGCWHSYQHRLFAHWFLSIENCRIYLITLVSQIMFIYLNYTPPACFMVM